MTAPQVGDPAPAFKLRDHHGQEHSLDTRLGNRNVLLVFYPFAFTGVCTGEMRDLSEHAVEWSELGTDVMAVSCDPIPSLRAFADQEGLAIPLLSDFWPHGEVSSAYGAFDDMLGAAGRATFVIDRDGVVRWTVRTEIAQARDVADYVKALGSLR
ncbi:MAG TPA: peroxiredoxin [Mycobacteriales bacterium]|nr:peroxiredoxin [Mycobacteriales bacterium]